MILGKKIETPVFVLAGGQATRLRDPSETSRPQPTKVLRDINPDGAGDRPMLWHVLDSLNQNIPPRIVVLTSDHPAAEGDQVEALAHEWGELNATSLTWVREQTPLGTAGAVRNALAITEYSSPHLVVTPADTLFPFEKLQDMVDEHVAHNAAVTWAVTSNPGRDAQNTDRLIIDGSSGSVQLSLEPLPEENVLDHMNPEYHSTATSAGILVLNTEFFQDVYGDVFDRLHGSQPIDLYRHFIPTAIPRGLIHSYDIAEPAPDLGTPDRLRLFGQKVLIDTAEITTN